VFLSALVAGSLGAPPAPPVAPDPSRYYMILFGGQSVPYVPRTAHTWATYAKVTPAATGSLVVESVTISWLPAFGPVVPTKIRSEPGKNYSLEETFAISAEQNARVSMWGPYETDAERYERALAQARRLESGSVTYRVLDNLGIRRSVQHCVHAVTYADPVMRYRLQPVIQVGEPGTSRLAKRYLRAGAFRDPEVTHDWLIPVLGIDRHPVIHREPGEFITRRLW
jgi:hypothetical protein